MIRFNTIMIFAPSIAPGKPSALSPSEVYQGNVLKLCVRIYDNKIKNRRPVTRMAGNGHMVLIRNVNTNTTIMFRRFRFI